MTRSSHSITATQKAWQENVFDTLIARGLTNADAHVFEKRLLIIRTHLSKSPTGKMMLDWADRAGVDIWLDDGFIDNSCNGLFIMGSNTVILNANSPDQILATTLAHELLHVWQDHTGLLSPVINHPFQHLIAIRLAEAAAAGLAFRVYDEMDETILAGIKYKEKLDGSEAFSHFILDEKGMTHYDARIKRGLDQHLTDRPTAPARPLSKFIGAKRFNDVSVDHRPVVPRKTIEYIERYGALPDSSNFLKGRIKDWHVNVIFSKDSEYFRAVDWKRIEHIRRQERRRGIHTKTLRG